MTEGKSGIVNPFAKTILSIEIKDDGTTKLSSSLPPDIVCKSLLSLTVDLIFGYMNEASEKKTETANGNHLIKV